MSGEPGGHAFDDRQSRGVIALLVPHFPQRETGAIERGMVANRRFEERRLRRRALGEQPLDVALERPERRLRRCRRAAGGTAGQTPGQSIEHREKVAQLATLDDMWLQASDIDADAPCLDGELVARDAVQPQTTSDAPSICPTLMTVARLKTADTGRCS